jgi:hypothetical protein
MGSGKYGRQIKKEEGRNIKKYGGKISYKNVT